MNNLQDKKAEKKFFNKQGKSDSTVYEPLFSNIIGRITRDINKHFPDKDTVRILEAGCGSGSYGRKLGLLGFRAIGVDISENVLLHANTLNYSVLVGDLENAIFRKRIFNCIISIGFLHHVPNLSKSQIIDNFSAWLSKGGLVFILEPNGDNIVNMISKIIGRIFLKIRPNNRYLSPNERNHRMGEYKNIFSRKGFEFLYSNPVFELAPDSCSGIMYLFVRIRKALQRTNDMLLPYSYKGWGHFMMFRKTA